MNTSGLQLSERLHHSGVKVRGIRISAVTRSSRISAERGGTLGRRSGPRLAAVTDMTTAGFGTMPPSIEDIKTGKLRGLAATTGTRPEALGICGPWASSSSTSATWLQPIFEPPASRFVIWSFANGVALQGVERARSRRRHDGSGQVAKRRMAQTTRNIDWPTYPLQTPSGGGLAPTPNRSTAPAEGLLAAREELPTRRPTSAERSLCGTEGLDNSRPVTEAVFDPLLSALGCWPSRQSCARQCTTRASVL